MNPSATPDDGLLRRVLVSVVSVLFVVGLMFLVARSHAPPPVAAAAHSADVEGLLAALTAEQRTTAAGRVREHCEASVTDACSCLETALREALDASLVDTARALREESTAACKLPLKGQQAEILVRSGDSKKAQMLAREALAGGARDPYASYALAQASWARGDGAAAQHLAEEAVANGRGSPAHLLVGLLALARNEVDVARGAFTRALESEPNDAAALYDIALSDHRLNHYSAAREGYLAVLRLNPRHLDARYNLVLLTSGAGFHEEAMHDLDELRAVTPPGDPRVKSLEATLAATPALPASSPVPPRGAAAPAPMPSGSAAPLH